MRILHILDHSLPLHSGYSFRSVGILKAQRELEWETVHLTSPKQGPSAALEENVEGWRFHRTPLPTSFSSRLPVLREIALMRATERRLNKLAEETRPDILHAHSPALNAWPALRVGRRRGIPVVYEVRGIWEDAAVDHGTATAGGPRYWAARRLETLALRRVAAVTTICDGLRHEIIARGIAPEKVTIIPNAVDLDEVIQPAEIDHDLAVELGIADSLVLGFIGSFYAYEGLDLLLEAAARLRVTRREVKVLLVGGGPDESHLRAVAKGLGLDNDVVYTGRVPHQNIQRYYSLVDVLVYPRRSIRLTELVTPLKPLEAMASGRIFVASDVGGHKELIDDRRTGYLFHADNVDDLVRCLGEVIDRRGEWSRIIAFHEAQPPLRTGKRGRKKRRIGHNLALRLRKHKEGCLRFLTDPRTPFTNNEAERDLRMAKLRQKISGGFRSERGAYNFARMRAVIATARKQGWNVLQTLVHPDPMQLIPQLRL